MMCSASTLQRNIRKALTPQYYDLVFAGGKALTDKIKVETGEEVTAGKLVLSATRTYAPVIKQILDKYRKQIDGMVHCSGGGTNESIALRR